MKTYSGPELLESRIAPAGIINVSLAGGVLKLTGDTVNNAVAVEVLANGTVDLMPTLGTQLVFNGNITSNLLNVPIVAPKLVVNLGEGNDNLEVEGNLSALTVDLGAGNDLMTFNTATVSGDTKILGRDGDEAIGTANSSSQRFYGKVTMDLGAGTDTVNFKGFDTFVAGKFSFVGGAGYDTFASSSYTTFGSDFSLNLGAGQALISATGSEFRVLGKTVITNNAAAGEILFAEITPQALVLQGGLSFTGGNGVNTLQFTPANSAEINSDLLIRSGSGSTSFQLQTSMVSVGGNVTVKSVGPLSFTLVGPQLLSVEGSVSAQSTAASNAFSLVGAGTIGGGLSVGGKTGGSVNLFGPFHIGKKAAFNFAQATASAGISISSTTFAGPVSVTTGSANDAVSLGTSTVAGKLTISTGGNNDTINFNTNGMLGTSSIVGGRVQINVGSGNDTVNIGFASASQFVTFFSPVVLIGGTGSDSLSFSSNSNILLAGSTVTGFEMGS